MQRSLNAGKLQVIAVVVGAIPLFAIALRAPAQSAASPTAAPATPPPTTNTALAVPPEEEAFDPAQHAFGDPFESRRKWYEHGVSIDPYLIVDYSKVFMGGLNTRSDSFRERFNLPIQVDTDKLLGWKGGTFVTVYQLQHGGNASHTLTGDAQNFSFGTDANGRSQLGQIWYQQKFGDFRLRGGKLDGNSDFDVLDNVQEFLNNSFSTSPTLALMPSFPDTGMGIQLFYEPESGFYSGAGVFDGSGARGTETGEYGPSKFLDRADNLFLITENGLRYKLKIDGHTRPGKIAAGGWFDTNPFSQLNGRERTDGTGGAYLIFDQLLWRLPHQRPIPAGPPGANPTERPEEEEYPGGIAMSASFGWADPLVNTIDQNALVGLSWTGPLSKRPIDIWGAGATYAHFSDSSGYRHDYELAIEMFYRLRITQWISLKPDIQYIIHPSGGGPLDESDRHNCLVGTLRLEMTF